MSFLVTPRFQPVRPANFSPFLDSNLVSGKSRCPGHGHDRSLCGVRRARRSRRMVDINPAAVRCARINAPLNVWRAKSMRQATICPVCGERFDFIHSTRHSRHSTRRPRQGLAIVRRGERLRRFARPPQAGVKAGCFNIRRCPSFSRRILQTGPGFPCWLNAASSMNG